MASVLIIFSLVFFSSFVPGWAVTFDRALLTSAGLYALAGFVVGWRWPAFLPPVALGPAFVWGSVLVVAVVVNPGGGQMGFVLLPAIFQCVPAMIGGLIGWLIHHVWLGAKRLANR